MEWLVTLNKDVEPEEIDQLLLQLGCERTGSPAIPLENDEQVVEVTGPHNLQQKLNRENRNIKISPNSTYSLYKEK